jgi:BarA-like signal transduction histidine kinase
VPRLAVAAVNHPHHPRATARLASKKKTPNSSVLLEAQRLICKKLGMPVDAEEEADQLQQRFQACFTNPLSSAQIDALSTLVERATMAGGAQQVTAPDV